MKMIRWNLKIFAVMLLTLMMIGQDSLWAKKRKLEISRFVPAPFGDFELLFANNLNVAGSIYGVKGDLKTVNLKPVVFHKGLYILNELVEPYPVTGNKKTINQVNSYIDISGGSIVFSENNSGVYMGSHLNALIGEFNSVRASDSVVALRTEHDIFISAGQNESTTKYKKVERSTTSAAEIRVAGDLHVSQKVFFNNLMSAGDNFWGMYVSDSGAGKAIAGRRAPAGGDQVKNLAKFNGDALRFRVGGSVRRNGIWKKRGLVVESYSRIDGREPILMIEGETGNVKIGAGSHDVDLTTEGRIFENGDDILPSGVIASYRGTLSSIPQGWVLCNGLHGTPDLRGEFIRGASSVTNKAVIEASKVALGHTHTYDHPEILIDISHGHAVGDWGRTYQNTTSSSLNNHWVRPKGSSPRHQYIWSTPVEHRHMFPAAVTRVPRMSYYGSVNYDPPSVMSEDATGFPVYRQLFLIMKL